MFECGQGREVGGGDLTQFTPQTRNVAAIPGQEQRLGEAFRPCKRFRLCHGGHIAECGRISRQSAGSLAIGLSCAKDPDERKFSKKTENRESVIEESITGEKVTRVRRGCRKYYKEGCDLCRFRFKLT